MDTSGFFLPFVIGLASTFAVTLFVVTWVTHERTDRAHDAADRRPKK